MKKRLIEGWTPRSLRAGQGREFWYFGEAVNNYRDGQLIHHTDSWEAGIDGAKLTPCLNSFQKHQGGETIHARGCVIRAHEFLGNAAKGLART
jgi:hypothetical protein